jgi:hypothetical protein
MFRSTKKQRLERGRVGGRVIKGHILTNNQNELEIILSDGSEYQVTVQKSKSAEG